MTLNEVDNLIEYAEFVVRRTSEGMPPEYATALIREAFGDLVKHVGFADAKMIVETVVEAQDSRDMCN